MEYKGKNWGKRLTPREAKVWGRWDKIWVENPDMAEDEILEQVAQEFDLTVEEVDSIAMKQFCLGKSRSKGIELLDLLS